MNENSLYMLLLGASPRDRHIEQHDVFFSIGTSVKEILPDVIAFWPEAGSTLHIDAWRAVRMVNGYEVQVLKREAIRSEANAAQLFFLNLGGYKPEEFEEYHYKMIVASTGKAAAIHAAKETAFYRHTGFKGATSHIDDKFGVDVDDVHQLMDILPQRLKEQFAIRLLPSERDHRDAVHLGYWRLDKPDRFNDDTFS